MKTTNRKQTKRVLPITFMSGFEPTRIIDQRTPGRLIDVLEETDHLRRYKEDFELAKSLGITTLRIAVPMHRSEKEPGVYDFTWIEACVKELREYGIEPIFDPMHHTSWTMYMNKGIAEEDFPIHYQNFVEALCLHFPHVKYYTIINEPQLTHFFCGPAQVWPPYLTDEKDVGKMFKNLIFSIRDISTFLHKHGKVHVYVESCEHHKGVDAKSKKDAHHRNITRFTMLDLLLGKVTEKHPMYKYYLNGMTQEEIADFSVNPVTIDYLGLDYYDHCDCMWGTNKKGETVQIPNSSPTGFANIALQYARRYRIPLMLSETNIRGYITDRISWCKYMLSECEKASKRLQKMNISFWGFCWYPFIDSMDWDSLLRKADGHIDPQGIIYLKEGTLERCISEFSEIVKKVATGEFTSKDIIPYKFRSPLTKKLKGFINGPMKNWKWRKPETK